MAFEYKEALVMGMTIVIPTKAIGLIPEWIEASKKPHKRITRRPKKK